MRLPNLAAQLCQLRVSCFNYDGKIDGSDCTLIDNAFDTQGASFGTNPTAIITAQIAGSSAVPEPVTLGMVVIGGALLRRLTSTSSVESRLRESNRAG